MKVDSKGDILELTETLVLIHKKGVGNALAQGLTGERSIDVSQITAIQFKKGGFMPGFIQFSYAGSKPFRGGLIEATQDPDAFVFEKALNDQMEAFKQAVEARAKAARDQKAAPAAPAANLAEQLMSLAELRKQGHLTEDEFQRSKDRLLGN